jgi:hypothetical protein
VNELRRDRAERIVLGGLVAFSRGTSVAAGVCMDGSTFDLADAFDAMSDLYSARSPHDAATIVACTLDAMIMAERIAVYLYDIDEDVMRRVAGKPDDGTEPTLALGSGLIGRAFLSATVETRHEPSDGEEAVLIRTVMVRGRVRGGIVVARMHDFSTADARLTDYVADRLAYALAG